jgi:hypothetical protein
MDNVIIWMVFGGVLIKLPVPPSELEIKHEADPKKYDIVGKGEVGVPQYPKLRTVKFKSFFPGDDAPYVQGGGSAGFYCNLIRTAMEQAMVGQFTIYRDENNSEGFLCQITEFKTTDKGGEPFDLYYSIELTEWVSYKPEKVVIKKSKKKKKVTATTKKERSDKGGKIHVGSKVTANGKYWYSSYGAKPFGTAKNLKTEVKRIVKGRKYPICIGNYGWVKEDQLQKR